MTNEDEETCVECGGTFEDIAGYDYSDLVCANCSDAAYDKEFRKAGDAE